MVRNGSGRRAVWLGRQAGVTLIELLVAVIVLVVLVSVGVPSFNSIFERNRISGAAQALYADLQFARAEAIKRNSDVYVRFDDGADWCYGIDDASAATCNCGAGTGCTVNGEQYIVTSAQFPGVSLSHNLTTGFGVDWVRFDPTRGTLWPLSPTVSMAIAGEGEVDVEMRFVGRVRLCAPGGYAGYEPC